MLINRFFVRVFLVSLVIVVVSLGAASLRAGVENVHLHDLVRFGGIGLIMSFTMAIMLTGMKVLSGRGD